MCVSIATTAFFIINFFTYYLFCSKNALSDYKYDRKRYLIFPALIAREIIVRFIP